MTALQAVLRGPRDLRPERVEIDLGRPRPGPLSAKLDDFRDESSSTGAAPDLT